MSESLVKLKSTNDSTDEGEKVVEVAKEVAFMSLTIKNLIDGQLFKEQTCSV